jgi:endonuclease-3
MPRESKQDKQQRAKRITDTLHRLYPDAECTLDHENPFQLLVATILSAQCTDERVNKETPALFEKFPAPADFAQADREEIEKAIRSTGFYRNKARSIQQASRDLVDNHDGKVPDSMDELVDLAGVGRKTANVILGVAFDKAVGVVVDTHVGRLSRRLRLTAKTQKNAVKIEKDLMEVIEQKDWIFISHALIQHGRRVCTSHKPDCDECDLSDLCPSAFTFEHNRK